MDLALDHFSGKKKRSINEVFMGNLPVFIGRGKLMPEVFTDIQEMISVGLKTAPIGSRKIPHPLELNTDLVNLEKQLRYLVDGSSEWHWRSTREQLQCDGLVD